MGIYADAIIKKYNEEQAAKTEKFQAEDTSPIPVRQSDTQKMTSMLTYRPANQPAYQSALIPPAGYTSAKQQKDYLKKLDYDISDMNNSLMNDVMTKEYSNYLIDSINQKKQQYKLEQARYADFKKYEQDLEREYNGSDAYKWENSLIVNPQTTAEVEHNIKLAENEAAYWQSINEGLGNPVTQEQILQKQEAQRNNITANEILLESKQIRNDIYENEQRALGRQGYRKVSGFDALTSKIGEGYYNNRYYAELGRDMAGYGSDERQQKYYDKKNDDKYKVYTSGTLNNYAGMIGEQIGQQFGSATSMEALTGTATGAAAGAAGWVTIPEGAFAGWKIGSSVNMGLMEAGSALSEMDDLGIPRETSEPIALVIGGANAGIEYLQLSALNGIYASALSAGKTELAGAIKQVLLTAGQEGLQEALQENVTMTGVSAAAQASGQNNPYTAKDVTGRTADAFVGGAALGFLYSGVGNAAGNFTKLSYNELNTLPDAELRGFNEDLTKAYTQNLKETTNLNDEQIQSYVGEAMKDKSRAGTINRILDLQNELGIEKKNSTANTQTAINSQTDVKPAVNQNAIVPTESSIKSMNVDTYDSRINAQTVAGNEQGSANERAANIQAEANKANSASMINNPQKISINALKNEDIQNRIDDKMVFSDNELQQMDKPALGKIMLRLAKLNAQDMKQLGLPQNTQTYIEEVGKIKNKPQMISTIRQIQAELKFGAPQDTVNRLSDVDLKKTDGNDTMRTIKNGVGEKVNTSQSKINEILKIKKGARPNPSTYLNQEYIFNHLSKFENGVTKFSSQNPVGNAGPPGGTFVMPSDIADDLITQSGGNIDRLEELLSLEPGALGLNPVRIDIFKPIGLRMPTGNEVGANAEWVPGGYTKGNIIEAVIDSPSPSQYTVKPILIKKKGDR